MKDEWVISRVFQKSSTGIASSTVSAATTTSGSAKKTRLTTTSTSSVYLPPLLDSTPREHVSCFSTISSVVSNNNNFNNGSFDFAPQPLALDPFARFQRNFGASVSAFPSLRSLQDNLHLPFFFSPAAQPLDGGGSGEVTVGNRAAPEEQRMADGGSNMAMGPSELDCMWGY